MSPPLSATACSKGVSISLAIKSVSWFLHSRGPVCVLRGKLLHPETCTQPGFTVFADTPPLAQTLHGRLLVHVFYLAVTSGAKHFADCIAR